MAPLELTSSIKWVNSEIYEGLKKYLLYRMTFSWDTLQGETLNHVGLTPQDHKVDLKGLLGVFGKPIFTLDFWTQ